MKIIKIAICFMALMALFNACEKPMEEITNYDYARAFSPINLKQTPSTFDVTTLEWQMVDGAREYVVELSRGDELLFNNIIATYETEATRLVLTDLWGETQYSVRVKSKAFNEGQQDSQWTSLAFKTNAEQIFLPLRNVDIKGTSILVRWVLPNGNITKLNVSGGSVDIGDVVLTPADLAAGAKSLTGLEPNRNYIVGIYDGEQRRGLVTPTTKWKPTGGEGDVVQVASGADLIAVTSDAGNIGKIIYLPDGYTFDVSTSDGILIAGNMTIYGDPDALVKPMITTSSTGGGAKLFRWPGACSIDTLKFVNLAFAATGAGNQSSVIHPGTAVGVDDIVMLKGLVFENCEAYDFGRCFIRIQNIAGSSPIDVLSLNNCFARNIGTYGGDNGAYAFVTLNIATGGIDKVTVTNSTFQKQYHSFVNAPLTTDNRPCKNVLIENCTFNDVMTGPTATTARYFIDGNNNSQIDIIIRNVIFGQSGPSSAGYRYGDGSAITVTNSYKTTDFTTTPTTADLPSLIAYPGSSTALFMNPAVGDFSIRDANFAGIATVGDPNWR
ncbi:MAG: DUF5123 domain-containing protein [Bacteroidales bacterium]|nr:DUF5123 domain-containing protein [Bacteroidales bacterium]MCL2133747.1 DUF5123 domain-containing protein [Bacteroidales bacterium]